MFEKKSIYDGIKGLCPGDFVPVMATRVTPKSETQSIGSFRIISVEQRHERSGRVVMLIDGEGLGETKTDLRKRHFTYKIDGVTDVEVKAGTWLMSPREDLGAILEVEVIGPWGSKRSKSTRVALRVQFDEVGVIRLNETWFFYASRPITRRMRSKWLKRMNEGAEQYYHRVLPGLLDSLLFESTEGISGKQISQIHQLENFILNRAIQLAISQETIHLTSTQLVQATKEILTSTQKPKR
ncbi:MAG: hypothetical protein ACFE89_01755 [Candidatus Hodarchaeota archaeon]